MPRASAWFGSHGKALEAFVERMLVACAGSDAAGDGRTRASRARARRLSADCARRRLSDDRIARGDQALARADLAEMQVRREPRTRGLVGAIAAVVVAGRASRRRIPRAARARRPRPAVQCLAKAAVPANASAAGSSSSSARLRRLRGPAPAACGRRQRRRLRIELRLAGAPERREHAVRPALSGADFPRLVQQRRVEALALEPGVAQRRP